MKNKTNNSIVMQFQKEFNKRLFLTKNIVSFEVPLIWKTLAECDQEIIRIILGDTGLHLLGLMDKIDLEHPDIVSIFDGVLSNENSFSQRCIEVINLAEFAKEKKFTNIFDIFEKTISQNAENTIKLICSDSKNKTSVRFLKNQTHRNELRSQKKPQQIDLSNLYKKGLNYWESLPNSFDKFLRFDDAYEHDLILAEEKAKQYMELGCTSLAEEINKTIEAFKTNIKQSYFGFNRLTMANASAILAKSLGFDFVYHCNNWDSFDKKNYAAINSKVVLDFLCKVFSVDICDITIPFVQDKLFAYEPRIYPFHYLKEVASNQTKRIVDRLEKLPEANNKPIFDHFAVIIPSIKLFDKNIEKKDWLIKNRFHFETKEDLIFYFDKTLLQKKLFNAIIIAEKDGKCYFICYFD